MQEMQDIKRVLKISIQLIRPLLQREPKGRAATKGSPVHFKIYLDFASDNALRAGSVTWVLTAFVLPTCGSVFASYARSTVHRASKSEPSATAGFAGGSALRSRPVWPA